MQRFKDRVVIITGAARGMGMACALSFLSEGAKAALVDINSNNVDLAAPPLSKYAGKVRAFNCDVASSQDVQKTVNAVINDFGTIDVLVNNAGILSTTTPLEDIEEEQWDRILNVNLKGVFLFAKAVLPIMRQKRYGKIVNISSSAGRSTSELGGAHYTVSKAGVLGLTRHAAREYGPFGINVNAICPGLVETPMIREKAGQEKLKFWQSQIPLGRFADTAEEADLVMFLASDQASYITGASIDFNGGSLLL